MSYVYAGQYIRINLTTGEQKIETISQDAVRRYYLGSGYAAKLYYEEMDPALDPLDPRSALYIFNGLLTGSIAPTGCRCSWCGRGPLTGIWNEANVGGHWGAELRFAGFDGLVITGKAERPVYLYVHDGAVEVRDAAHLWGLDTFDAYDRLVQEVDSPCPVGEGPGVRGKARAAVIGPAGENLVRFAAIMQGGRDHSRAAGRGGMGALLGSKNIKAIVARGRDKPTYADAAGFRELVKQDNTLIKEHSLPMTNYGTAGGLMGAEAKGDVPIRNWQEGAWPEGAKKISGQAMHDAIWVKHTFCHACPIGCGKLMEIKTGPYAGVRGEGPEYETLAGFGAMLMVDDMEAVVRANDLCNRYGLDTISTSSAIAFAFEASEKGWEIEIEIEIERGDRDRGLWGNGPLVHRLIEMIAYRRGVGDMLAEGTRRAAARLGGGADEFAIHVKGLEMAYHDPRAFVSMAANYATANRGACHLESLSYWRGYGVEFEGWQDGPHDRFATEGAGRLTVEMQNYIGTYNPLGLCKFIAKAGFTPAQMAELVGKAMGWDLTAEELLQTGERLFNLKRLINNRLGVTREDDTLPVRLLTRPRPSGGAQGNLPDLETMLAEYYQARGWGADGRPLPERLRAIGL